MLMFCEHIAVPQASLEGSGLSKRWESKEAEQPLSCECPRAPTQAKRGVRPTTSSYLCSTSLLCVHLGADRHRWVSAQLAGT